MSRRKNRNFNNPGGQPENILPLPPLPSKVEIPPMTRPWTVQKQERFFFLTRLGTTPYNRAGMAALALDDEQAALDLAEALNAAYERRTRKNGA